MLRAAADAVEFTDGLSRSDLDADRKLQLALTQLCVIIGEAAAQIPRHDCAKYPEIPWPQIVGLRNRIVHGYFDVDMDIVWQIIQQDLPSLITQLEKILKTN